MNDGHHKAIAAWRRPGLTATVLLATLLTVSTVVAANGQSDGTATGADNLDLREANVMQVKAVLQDTANHRFEVTLFHDDDGEDGYANWWQIESLEGEQLGRRTLLHSHGTREFTRSESIHIPEATTWVVVRGHDQVHDYGGQAAVLNLRTGGVWFVDQGAEPEDFAEWTPSSEPADTWK